MSAEILTRLERERKELLDLGLRNPLLNFRKRAKQVKVIDEVTAEVFRLLVVEGKSMSFEALPDEKMEELAEQETGGTGTDEIDWDSLLGQPDEAENEKNLAARHTDKKLQTDISSEKMQARLLSIHRDARTYIEEQGVNILFLALGFLYWYEAPSAQEPRRAPLLLLPVELTRQNAQARFQLAWTGDDISDNLSLAEKLRSEFSIELPKIGNPEDLNVAAYFQDVASAFGEDRRWKVEPNEISLSFFSFGKFLIYKDLDLADWPEGTQPGEHVILSALLSNGFRESESIYGDEDHIDEHVSPAEIHQVMDADSSQTLAILDINAGRNMVLQGPPGTGKSQTITNVIAEAIGNGRKVLFVSEKMAALEVVKRRLDQVGLGDAVLELHSHKTNKKKLLDELNRTLHQGRPNIGDPSDDIETLTRLRNQLNAYCEAVNSPIGKTSTTFVRALGYAVRTTSPQQTEPLLAFEKFADWTEADYREARMLVGGLDRHLAEYGPPDRNPFRSSRLTEFLPSQYQTLDKALAEALELTKALRLEGNALAEAMELQHPEVRKDAEALYRAAMHAIEAPHLEGVQLTSGEWQSRYDDLLRLTTAGRCLNELHAHYDEWLVDEAWSQDLREVRQDYVDQGSVWWWWWYFLFGSFRRSQARLEGLFCKALPKHAEEALAIIDAVLDSQKHRKTYEELAPLGQEFFGAQWKQEQSDWIALEKLTEWVVTLYQDIADGVMPKGIVDFLASVPCVDRLKEQVDSVRNLLESHAAAMADVSNRLALNLEEYARIRLSLPLEEQAKYLNDWRSHLDALYHQVRFNQIAEDMHGKNLAPILQVAKEWDKGAGTLLQAFDHAWYSALVERAYQEKEPIKRFDRSQQEHKLDEFSRLDKLLFEHNQARLALMHWETLPKLSGGGELSIINREIHKKRRHVPIRKLIREAGHAVQAIKPVFMMSPMSIATFLPPGALQFDLVVFDEASQVKPVDAFGAILRGTQTVVVGDSKQLPPTNFFNTLNDDDNEEEDESAGDMESILSLLAAKGAPERMLRWHYRSRNESLIAVSNNEFYDNRLVVFPSPGVNPQARGLRLHHLTNTAYDRGKTATNPEEAKTVAEAIMQHARTSPDLSLGVVAFSVAQRDAIEMQLEVLRRRDPSCEYFFKEGTREPFFVKNLETVQGDERDMIFISIGYGRAGEGPPSMNFGPLNKEGGERRLNVLISRARLAMDVFTNFTASDMDMSRSKARGVVALRNFLAYAENGILEVPRSTGREPDSPFEEGVIRALQAHGVTVEPQVGTAGFFIDIAVKDPEHPGLYILGIECDGASYHSARSARDRDRLRQEVLEGLGWRFHRIWSTDWYRNPQGEIERALAAIERAKTYWQTRSADAPKRNEDAEATEQGIERTQETRQEVTSGLTVNAYQRATVKIPLGNRELHEFPLSELIPHIESVVQTESPVLRGEVIRKITEGAGLKRAGSRIQGAVGTAIKEAVSQGIIRQKGEFLWALEMDRPPVRDRSVLDAGSRKMELVAPEEIAESLIQEIESAFSIVPDEAIQCAARRLGFSRVSEQSRQLIDGVLTNLIDTGRIHIVDARLALKERMAISDS